jgi:hypothetical protein
VRERVNGFVIENSSPMSFEEISSIRAIPPNAGPRVLHFDKFPAAKEHFA